MNRGIFITGTDTGVGKTVFSALLLRALLLNDYSACPFKPIETGCRRDGEILLPEDGEFLKEMTAKAEPIKNITPYCFEHPVAPMVAAELEGKEIEIERIKKTYKELSLKYDLIVTEGAGGLMVPIREDYYYLDLALELRLPVVVVALNRLGVINHTLLTLEVLDKYGLKVLGVVLNNLSKDPLDQSRDSNLHTLKRLIDVDIFINIPGLKQISREELDRVALQTINVEQLLNALN
ncbi:MAG: dethiobiotin synthase [Nitrospirae bacterium]|nr:MAG: dethiobiotin synthase [Nitrospirota bacterium]